MVGGLVKNLQANNMLMWLRLGYLAFFAEADATIPTQPTIKYVGGKPVDIITLDIFLAGNSFFNLHEDDGRTLSYQQGGYTLTNINSIASIKQLKLQISKPEEILLH